MSDKNIFNNENKRKEAVGIKFAGYLEKTRTIRRQTGADSTHFFKVQYKTIQTFMVKVNQTYRK